MTKREITRLAHALTAAEVKGKSCFIYEERLRAHDLISCDLTDRERSELVWAMDKIAGTHRRHAGIILTISGRR